MTRDPMAWGVLGVAAAVLGVIGYATSAGRTPGELFALPLVLQVVCATALAWRGRWREAGVLGSACAVLLVVSLLPIYVPHWALEDGAPHRHTIWELGHVH